MNNIACKAGLGVRLWVEAKQCIPITQQRALSLINAKKDKSDDKPVAKNDFKPPVKFTKSAAYIDYKATENFYGGDHRDLPKSHNFVLAFSGVFGFAYLIFLRDDIENDGGINLFKPVHESVPQIAIPLLQSTIAENKRQGLNTQKLEKKLAEYMERPEAHGHGKPKLVEN